MRRVAACLLFCSLPLIVSAQHGKTESPGVYTFSYKGDTWTGEIVAVEQDTREIMLQYTDKKGQTEKFTAKLVPEFKAFVKDHPEQKVSILNQGDKIIAYYVAIGQKYPVTDEHGKKKDIAATENLVFQAESFPQRITRNRFFLDRPPSNQCNQRTSYSVSGPTPGKH